MAGDRPLPVHRKLWDSPEGGPVLVAVGPAYPEEAAEDLRARGVEVVATTLAGLLDDFGADEDDEQRDARRRGRKRAFDDDDNDLDEYA